MKNSSLVSYTVWRNQLRVDSNLVSYAICRNQ